MGLLLVHLYYRAQAYLARSRGRPLPPGPRRLPIVGNLFDIPKRHPWIAYEAYSRQYGTECLRCFYPTLTMSPY